MNFLLSKKVGTRTIITGTLLFTLSIIVIMMNLFNLYGKASSNQIESKVSLTNNQIITNIGIAGNITSLVVIAFGVIIFEISSKRNK